LTTKVNANIGLRRRFERRQELQKLSVSIEAAADAGLDLSVAGSRENRRPSFALSVPVGTVPVYEARAGAFAQRLLDFRVAILAVGGSGAPGVEFFSIHSSSAAPAALAGRNLMGNVSLAGPCSPAGSCAIKRKSNLQIFDKIVDNASL
jgi:thiamine biosynthesis protein ThiC